MNKYYETLARNWYIDVLGITVCAALTGLCYIALIRPVTLNRVAYAQLQPQLAERAQAVKKAKARLTALQTELEVTKTQLADLPLRLEPSSRVNNRLAQLTDLAAEMGIEVHQVQPDPARAGKRYDVVEITLSGSGDYGQVTHFMRGVHDTFADTAIVEFDLKSAGTTVSAAQFNIGLAWYTLPAMGFVEN